METMCKKSGVLYVHYVPFSAVLGASVKSLDPFKLAGAVAILATPTSRSLGGF